MSHLRMTQAEVDAHRRRIGAIGVIAERAAAAVTVPLPKRGPGRPKGTKNNRTMNKWEMAFSQTLELRKQAGELVWWAFEPFRIRLANGTFYRPDFATVDQQGRTEIYEVKGHMREAARIRLRVAVEKLPYRFYLVRKHKGDLRVTPV